MADDNQRIEARISLTGRGLATTPERIAELEQQAAKLERTARPKTKSFSAVLAQGQTAPTAPSKKQRDFEALPKKGPRPSLAHPSLVGVFGREDADEDVVLKG